MNNITYNQYTTNFQFLSVCHYITSFGLFFYNHNLIPLDRRNHSSCVLNTFFDYIHNSENETETKLQLLRKVLKGSDLYGGGENETLDMKYLNETYQYIISSALFSHYGNIYGYLAQIINRSDNITYLALKEKVFQELSKTYISRDYCSSRYESFALTNLTINKVFNEYIWSMFPEPEKNNMEIMDINYIYAMIGLKIARSVQADSGNLSFDSYILLSQGIEIQTIDDESYQLAMELFATPALFYYASKERENFSKKDISVLINSNKFWQEAFETFFHFLNFSLQTTIRSDYEKSLHYKLEMELKSLENRTHIASKILKTVCNYSSYEEIPSFFVNVYKTSQFMLTYVLPDRCQFKSFPNLEKLYNSQFEYLTKLFNEIEQNSLERVLVNGKLIEKMNSNASVKFASVPNYEMHCMYCAPLPRKMNSDIYLLFAITENEETDFYAIRQENNTLTLLSSSVDEPEFSRAVANVSFLRMEVTIFSRFLKKRGEDYRVFIQRIADIKTEQFVQGLKNYYLDPTTGEKVIDFMKSLVPFYTCIESIKSGNEAGAVLSCSLDILTLLPVAGVAAKYSTKLWSTFLVEIGNQAFWSLPKLSIRGMGQIYRAVSRSLTEEILTRQLLRDFTVASLRTLDPGFELSFQIGRFSSQVLRRMFQSLSSRLTTISKNLLLPVESTMNVLRNPNLLPDETALVPKVIDQNNYNMVRYLYPGGSNYFGPKCLTSFGKVAEMRTIEGNTFQVPVVPLKSSGSSVHYQEYNPKTGKVSKEKLEIGRDDILRRVGIYIHQAAAEGKDITVVRNYHVYHNTMEWHPQAKENLNDNFNPPTEGDNPSSNLEPSSEDLPTDNTPKTSKTPENSHIPLHGLDTQQTFALLKKFKKNGLSALKEDKELLQFRRMVNSIDSYQTMQKVEQTRDLWIIQEQTRPSIVNLLKNLKEKQFYFNDITLVTDIPPSEIILKKKIKFSLKTEVRYHIKVNSQYGFINLAAVNKDFMNQYLVFPEVDFFVTDTKFVNGKEILIVELKHWSLKKEQWIKIRERDNMLLDNRQIVETPRGESVEKAALFISTNTPLKKFSESETFLKQYILKLVEDNTVPSYDSLARDIYAGTTLPEKYNKWKIKNHKFIDDVLYQKKLQQVDNLKSAKRTINKIYGGIYSQKVDPVFEIYHNSPTIKNLVRFEDFYIIFSLSFQNFLLDVNAYRRITATMLRLALRQSAYAEKLNPVKIYYSINLAVDEFDELITLKTGSDLMFTHVQAFQNNREYVLKNAGETKASDTLVLYELEVTNRACFVDLSSIFDDPNGQFFVLADTALRIMNRRKEIISGRNVFVVTLQDDMLLTEERIVNTVNMLHSLLSKDTKFYYNDLKKRN
ncbi:uncharacterized protein LOC122506620 [Leptopilina heterotoma]|uniref:uncharacterized protein LOC122506620 n=1 Tax=Leptopilina heterotoma TaxID=63436 RepID=UPI001CA7B727|nr:uncharacterized protein LOC122506620 [Leptopilina heterotoma]